MQEYNFICDGGYKWQSWQHYIEQADARIDALENYWKKYQPDYQILQGDYTTDFIQEKTINKTIYYFYNPIPLWLHHGLQCNQINSYFLNDSTISLKTIFESIDNASKINKTDEEVLQNFVQAGQLVELKPGSIIFNNNRPEDYGTYSDPNLIAIYNNIFAGYYTGYYDGSSFVFNYEERAEEENGLISLIPLIYQGRIIYYDSLMSTYTGDNLNFYGAGEWNNNKMPPLCQFYDDGEEVILDYTWQTGTYIFDNSKKSYYNINIKEEDKKQLTNLKVNIF